MSIAYLLLGGNKGDVITALRKACVSIEKQIGTVLLQSSFYESEAWGFNSDNFINQVMCVDTNLSPKQLLQQIHQIESNAGRVRTKNKEYEARTLDIDILFYDDSIIETNDLNIPHPRMHERRFTLLPLNEIAPDFIHPVFRLSINQLLQQTTDRGKVDKLNFRIR